jgi:hypothetical protein
MSSGCMQQSLYVGWMVGCETSSACMQCWVLPHVTATGITGQTAPYIPCLMANKAQ